MVEIIDLDDVIVDGQPPQDLVSAIANNLQGDLVGILAALKGWDANRAAETDAAATAAIQQANAAEIEQLRSQLQAKAAEITQLKTQLSPAIHEILPALEAAGLSKWAGSAITAADDDEAAMNLVIALRSIATESPSWNQCDRIKQLFGQIVQMSGVYPDSEQAAAMQAILDEGPNSTGPVSPDKLNFHQFMGS